MFDTIIQRNAAQTADRRYNKHLLDHGVQPAIIEKDAAKSYDLESNNGSYDRFENSEQRNDFNNETEGLNRTFEKDIQDYSQDDYDDESSKKDLTTSNRSSSIESISEGISSKEIA